MLGKQKQDLIDVTTELDCLHYDYKQLEKQNARLKRAVRRQTCVEGGGMKFGKLICYLFGHNYRKYVEIDNGRSKYGYFKCSRCEHEDAYQYDYNIN